MIYFRCPHCGAEHPSAFQLESRALFHAQPDTVAVGQCPFTERPVSYRLADAMWRDEESDRDANAGPI